MIGFVKKDLLMIRNNLKFVFIMIIVFSITSITGNGNYAFIPSFISAMLIISTFSYDEFNHWDAYALTLPNGRDNVVKAKYIVTIFLIIICLVLTSALALINCAVTKQYSLEEIVLIPLGVSAGILCFLSVFLPIIFKLGVERGRVSLFIVVVAFVGVITLISKLSFPESLILTFTQNTFWIIPILVLLFLFGSYSLSKHIYKKKEF